MDDSSEQDYKKVIKNILESKLSDTKKFNKISFAILKEYSLGNLRRRAILVLRFWKRIKKFE